MPVSRSLMRAPAVSAAAILTFAAVTAIVATSVALVWHIVVRPLPFPDAERLVFVWNRYGTKDVSSSALSPPDFDDRRAARSFESSAAWRPGSVNLTAGTPERLTAARVTDDFFRVLRVEPALGRPFARGEENAAILSDALWRRSFGARREIVGTAIQLDGRAVHVAGVMPAGFALIRPDTDIWLPLRLSAADVGDDNRGNENLMMIARLAEGATIESARAEMSVITAAVIGRVPHRRAFLDESRWHVSVFSMRDDVVRRHRPALWILFSASMLVLLLGATNVAGLFVARTVARQKEFGVRIALGASRFRIAREVTREVALLALVGIAIGIPLAMAAIPVAASSGIPRAHELRISAEVMLFSASATLLTALAIGFSISVWAWRSRIAGDARGGTAAPAATRIRTLLVATQLAVALTLLTSGTLLVESYRRLRAVEIGFNPANLVTWRVALPDSSYPEPAQRRAFFMELQKRVLELPGMSASSAVSDLPFSENDWTATFDIEGRDQSLETPAAHWRVVLPQYEKTMGIALVAGRTFNENDRDGTLPVCVIDESAARRYWPEGSPIGRSIQFGESTFQVVGVLAGVRHGSLADEAEPHVYLPLLQRRENEMYGVVRSSGDPGRVAADVRAIVRSLDPALPLFAISTMDVALQRSVAQPRLRAALVGTFAAVGAALALIGLAGLLAYVVASRTRELGVRIALGASPSEIAGLVARRALSVSLSGLAAGALGATLMVRSMRGLFYGVDSLQLQICAAAALLFLIVAMLASLAPALRAARIDPAAALRQE